MTRSLRLSILLAVLSAFACGGENEASTETPSEAPTTTATPAPPAQDGPAGPRAEDESFVLEARPEEGGYTSGSLGRFAIVIEGKEGWHLNHEFPVSVELTGTEVSFPKAALAKEDAAEFVDERARFDVPFTPGAAGEREVRAVVSFAMCNPTSCVPKSHTVALALNVQ
ncbi:MAG: hypothetical protein H6722_05530 [Sandaracinus sp.]|nr:hypothetical protein [Sandaracinus sp.]